MIHLKAEKSSGDLFQQTGKCTQAGVFITKTLTFASFMATGAMEETLPCLLIAVCIRRRNER